MDKEDYLGKYKSISAKLKKKFLRKPNVAEGSEQFGILAKTLNQQESYQYAAFCRLAQARCEHTLGNCAGEAGTLTQAARSFIQAHNSLLATDCPNFNENMDAAINCYSHAIRVYGEAKEPALAAALSMEVGNNLRSQNRSSEAIAHYIRAASMQGNGTTEHLLTLSTLAAAQIETRLYEEALITLTTLSMEICAACQPITGSLERPWACYSDLLRECETTLVLLLLILQPTQQQIDPRQAAILEKYTWLGTPDNTNQFYMEEDYFLLLQSTVMACQSKDFESLEDLQTQLWRHLTPLQNDLFMYLMQNMQDSPPCVT